MDTLLDPALAQTRVMFGMAEAEFAQRVQWRASAETFRAIDNTLREAAAHPEVFIDEQMLRSDAVELAVRAAAADLAIRLNVAEATVRSQGHIASTLRERMPVLWSLFVEGEVSTQNAREAASLVLELPVALWGAFDSQLTDVAGTMTPSRFRAKAYALREKLHVMSRAARHEVATRQRRVFTELERDGMGWVHSYLSAEKLARVNAQLDGSAFDLFREPDETRTMAQLRADVFVDLLIGDAQHSRVNVALTIPVLSLLGSSDEPALLEGVGPIDLDTARVLMRDAPSLTRLLTNPGCGRRAINCDVDHTTAWSNGGLTTAQNLVPRCRKHHTLKHQAKWQVEKPSGSDRAIWTSPTGNVRDADPPPF